MDSKSIVKWCKLSYRAYTPLRKGDGYLLRSARRYSIDPHGQIIVKTDIQFTFPPGTCGQIIHVSKNYFQYHPPSASDNISIESCVIDIDSTGNMGIVLCNDASHELIVNKGDIIAQLICETININPCLQEVYDVSLPTSKSTTELRNQSLVRTLPTFPFIISHGTPPPQQFVSCEFPLI